MSDIVQRKAGCISLTKGVTLLEVLNNADYSKVFLEAINRPEASNPMPVVSWSDKVQGVSGGSAAAIQRDATVHIDLSSKGIDADTLEKLVVLLLRDGASVSGRNDSKISLNFSRNKIDDNAICHLVKLLLQQKSAYYIKEIDLSDNKLSSKGCYMLLVAFGFLQEKYPAYAQKCKVYLSKNLVGDGTAKDGDAKQKAFKTLAQKELRAVKNKQVAVLFNPSDPDLSDSESSAENRGEGSNSDLRQRGQPESIRDQLQKATQQVQKLFDSLTNPIPTEKETPSEKEKEGHHVPANKPPTVAPSVASPIGVPTKSEGIPQCPVGLPADLSTGLRPEGIPNPPSLRPPDIPPPTITPSLGAPPNVGAPPSLGVPPSVGALPSLGAPPSIGVPPALVPPIIALNPASLVPPHCPPPPPMMSIPPPPKMLPPLRESPLPNKEFVAPLPNALPVDSTPPSMAVLDFGPTASAVSGVCQIHKISIPTYKPPTFEECRSSPVNSTEPVKSEPLKTEVEVKTTSVTSGDTKKGGDVKKAMDGTKGGEGKKGSNSEKGKKGATKQAVVKPAEVRPPTPATTEVKSTTPATIEAKPLTPAPIEAEVTDATPNAWDKIATIATKAVGATAVTTNTAAVATATTSIGSSKPATATPIEKTIEKNTPIKKLEKQREEKSLDLNGWGSLEGDAPEMDGWGALLSNAPVLSFASPEKITVPTSTAKAIISAVKSSAGNTSAGKSNAGNTSSAMKANAENTSGGKLLVTEPKKSLSTRTTTPQQATPLNRLHVTPQDANTTPQVPPKTTPPVATQVKAGTPRSKTGTPQASKTTTPPQTAPPVVKNATAVVKSDLKIATPSSAAGMKEAPSVTPKSKTPPLMKSIDTSALVDFFFTQYYDRWQKGGVTPVTGSKAPETLQRLIDEIGKCQLDIWQDIPEKQQSLISNEGATSSPTQFRELTFAQAAVLLMVAMKTRMFLRDCSLFDAWRAIVSSLEVSYDFKGEKESLRKQIFDMVFVRDLVANEKNLSPFMLTIDLRVYLCEKTGVSEEKLKSYFPDTSSLSMHALDEFSIFVDLNEFTVGNTKIGSITDNKFGRPGRDNITPTKSNVTTDTICGSSSILRPPPAKKAGKRHPNLNLNVPAPPKAGGKSAKFNPPPPPVLPLAGGALPGMEAMLSFNSFIAAAAAAAEMTARMGPLPGNVPTALGGVGLPQGTGGLGGVNATLGAVNASLGAGNNPLAAAAAGLGGNGLPTGLQGAGLGPNGLVPNGLPGAGLPENALQSPTLGSYNPYALLHSGGIGGTQPFGTANMPTPLTQPFGAASSIIDSLNPTLNPSMAYSLPGADKSAALTPPSTLNPAAAQWSNTAGSISAPTDQALADNGLTNQGLANVTGYYCSYEVHTQNRFDNGCNLGMGQSYGDDYASTHGGNGMHCGNSQQIYDQVYYGGNCMHGGSMGASMHNLQMPSAQVSPTSAVSKLNPNVAEYVPLGGYGLEDDGIGMHDAAIDAAIAGDASFGSHGMDHRNGGMNSGVASIYGGTTYEQHMDRTGFTIYDPPVNDMLTHSVAHSHSHSGISTHEIYSNHGIHHASQMAPRMPTAGSISEKLSQMRTATKPQPARDASRVTVPKLENTSDFKFGFQSGIVNGNIAQHKLVGINVDTTHQLGVGIATQIGVDTGAEGNSVDNAENSVTTTAPGSANDSTEESGVKDGTARGHVKDHKQRKSVEIETLHSIVEMPARYTAPAIIVNREDIKAENTDVKMEVDTINSIQEKNIHAKNTETSSAEKNINESIDERAELDGWAALVGECGWQ